MTGYAIPKPTSTPTNGAIRWVEPDEIIIVNGSKIVGGGFYYGCADENPGHNIASLINPTANDPAEEWKPPSDIPVFLSNRSHTRRSYPSMTSVERREYLLWLSTDRPYGGMSYSLYALYLSGIESRILTHLAPAFFASAMTDNGTPPKIVLDEMYRFIDELGRANQARTRNSRAGEALKITDHSARQLHQMLLCLLTMLRLRRSPCIDDETALSMLEQL